eukprot:66998-Prymnesium_polylepis.2
MAGRHVPRRMGLRRARPLDGAAVLCISPHLPPTRRGRSPLHASAARLTPRGWIWHPGDQGDPLGLLVRGPPRPPHLNPRRDPTHPSPAGCPTPLTLTLTPRSPHPLERAALQV